MLLIWSAQICASLHQLPLDTEIMAQIGQCSLQAKENCCGYLLPRIFAIQNQKIRCWLISKFSEWELNFAIDCLVIWAIFKNIMIYDTFQRCFWRSNCCKNYKDDLLNLKMDLFFIKKFMISPICKHVRIICIEKNPV